MVAKENFTSAVDVKFSVDSLDSIFFFGLVEFSKELMTQSCFLLKSVGNLSRTYYERRRVKVTARGNVLVGRYSSTLSVERLRLKEIEPTGLQYSDQQYLHTRLYCWICLHRFNNPIVTPSRRARRVLPTIKSTLMGTFT